MSKREGNHRRKAYGAYVNTDDSDDHRAHQCLHRRWSIGDEAPRCMEIKPMAIAIMRRSRIRNHPYAYK